MANIKIFYFFLYIGIFYFFTKYFFDSILLQKALFELNLKFFSFEIDINNILL